MRLCLKTAQRSQLLGLEHGFRRREKVGWLEARATPRVWSTQPGAPGSAKPMQDRKAQLPCAFVILARPQTRVPVNFLKTRQIALMQRSIPSNRDFSGKPVCRGPGVPTVWHRRSGPANQTNLLLAPPQPPFGNLSKRPRCFCQQLVPCQGRNLRRCRWETS